MTIALALPKLRNDQAAIISHPAKVKVLPMGRRWGKTVLGGVVEMNVLRQHGRAAWIVPTYKNGRSLWRWVSDVCKPLEQAGHMSISKSERVITTHAGGFFAMYSAENIDSIRSEAFNLVVGDEAAKIDGDGWNDAVRPTLADADGDEILISTPKGKNWFYYEYLKGQAQNDGYMSWTAPTKANPIETIRRAYELAKTRVPERTFRQEWEAQFVEDGVLFRNVVLRELAKKIDKGIDGRQYIIGADWGRTNDATVFSVLDMQAKTQVYMDRMTDTDYYSQRIRLKALHEKFNKSLCLVETNSIGQPQLEELQRMGVSVRGFQTTNATKGEIISALQLAFEQETITILDDKVQEAELLAYQSQTSASGLVRYNAPEGMHDDTVMALALAWWGGVANRRDAADLVGFA